MDLAKDEVELSLQTFQIAHQFFEFLQFDSDNGMLPAWSNLRLPGTADDSDAARRRSGIQAIHPNYLGLHTEHRILWI
jgi:hypothetical protein